MSNGTVVCNLIYSEGKQASSLSTSLPRLELSAGLIKQVTTFLAGDIECYNLDRLKYRIALDET